MTNAEIENMLTVITKAVNTFREVTSNIDELLGYSHTFTCYDTINKPGVSVACYYIWSNPATEEEEYPNHTMLTILIYLSGVVIASFICPLLQTVNGCQRVETTLDAPDLNSALLLLVGSCCHKPVKVCQFCGL